MGIGSVDPTRTDGPSRLRSVESALWIFLVKLVGPGELIVESDDIESVGDAFFIGVVNRGRDHTGGVQFVNTPHHRRTYLCALFRLVSLQPQFLVADGP